MLKFILMIIVVIYEYVLYVNIDLKVIHIIVLWGFYQISMKSMYQSKCTF